MRRKQERITHTAEKDRVLSVTVVAEPEENAAFAAQPITAELERSICPPGMKLRRLQVTSAVDKDRVVSVQLVLGAGGLADSVKRFVLERLEKLLRGPELFDQGDPPVGMDPETGEVLDEGTLKEVQEFADGEVRKAVQELVDKGVTVEMPGRTGRGEE
ncbi:MAG: hypothetical protein HQ592_18575 [Planctomycetes bacterium]|nr:hypothetical protein [Planctomycetota bacterium]